MAEIMLLFYNDSEESYYSCLLHRQARGLRELPAEALQYDKQ